MKTRTFMTIMAGFSLMTLSAAFMATAEAQNVGTFTLSTQVNANGTLTPTLTWSTTPAASGCVASGDADWSGNKAAQGTQALTAKATSLPRSFALLCSWPGDNKAFITWTAPTTNTDNTPLTNLAGYRLFSGTAANALTQLVQIADPAAKSYTVDNLAPGTWYFALKAYTTVGAESAMSNVASKGAKAGVEWSQQTGIKVPAAPVLE